jgi:peptidoglycan/LPS O-acetylase OafA/YrhL
MRAVEEMSSQSGVRAASVQPSSAAPVAIAQEGFFTPLESLRGLAALTVVIYHAAWANPVTALGFFRNGPLMVDFFFVLSGFVICHSYGQHLSGLRDVRRFVWLRLGRLYPLHFAFLLVFVGIELAKYIAQQRYGLVADKPAFTANGPRAFVANVLLIHALGLPGFPKSLTFNYPSWSISTEFYAYLLFALVRLRAGGGLRFVLASGGIVALSAALLLLGGKTSLAESGNGWAFFRCCGGFFLGVLTYYGYRWLSAELPAERRQRALAGSLAPLLLAATILFLSSDLTGAESFLLPLLGAGVILSTIAFPNRWLIALLRARPLMWLGKVSYSTYMVHAAIVWTLTQFLTLILKMPQVQSADGPVVATAPLFGSLLLGIYLVMVLVVSHFTFKWIEDPCRRRARQLAGKWFDKRRGAP